MAENDSVVMDGTEDVALNFGDEEEQDKRKKLKHPLAVFFHVLFRVLAVVAYLFCGWFSNSFITNFVVIVLLLSLDFWTVKNITGRLLVGLRWWNHVDEDGKSHWVYESRKGSAKNKVTMVESQIFWLSLVASEIIWVVFFFATIFTFKFKWFGSITGMAGQGLKQMVVLVGLLMNGANLYGYVRCKYGARKKLSAVASNFLGQQVLKGMMSAASTSATSDKK